MTRSLTHKILIEALILLIGIGLLLIFPFHRLYFDVLELQNKTMNFNSLSSGFKWREVIYPEFFTHVVLLALHLTRIAFYLPNKKLGSEKLFDYFQGKMGSIKLTLLKYGVKFFFIPIMLFQAMYYTEYCLEILSKISTSDVKGMSDWISNIFYTIVWNFALCITLWIYLFGYIIESKKLNSEIISVDRTFLGWFSALICYNIFFTFLSYFYPLMGSKDAYFASESINMIVRIFIISLIILRIVTVINLGSKCSNLTYRGVVSNGMYSLIRHPHYFLKLVTWWILFVPFYYEFPQGQYLLGMLVWTGIYLLRIWTEERHLSQFEDYLAYKKKVKYRLIPFIW